MPYDGLISDKYVGDKLNPYFCPNIYEKLLKMGLSLPETWFYAHTHQFTDVQFGSTRFICSPRGYPGENENYNWEYCVTV